MQSRKSIQPFGLPTISRLSKNALRSSKHETKKDSPSVIRKREGSDLIIISRTFAKEWNMSIKFLRTSRHISSNSTARTRNGKRYRIAFKREAQDFPSL